MTALDTLNRNRAMANGTLDGSSWAVTAIQPARPVPDSYDHLIGRRVMVTKGPYVWTGRLLAVTDGGWLRVQADPPALIDVDEIRCPETVVAL